MAVLAHYHHIPFYVCAPYSTVDLSLPSGASIPIEQRNPDEVRTFGGAAVAPAGVKCYNPVRPRLMLPLSVIASFSSRRSMSPRMTSSLPSLRTGGSFSRPLKRTSSSYSPPLHNRVKSCAFARKVTSYIVKWRPSSAEQPSGARLARSLPTFIVADAW